MTYQEACTARGVRSCQAISLCNQQERPPCGNFSAVFGQRKTLLVVEFAHSCSLSPVSDHSVFVLVKKNTISVSHAPCVVA